MAQIPCIALYCFPPKYSIVVFASWNYDIELVQCTKTICNMCTEIEFFQHFTGNPEDQTNFISYQIFTIMRIDTTDS